MQLTNIKPFNSAMQAPATFKERVVWLLYMGGLFFLLYGSANEFAGASAPHLSVVLDWEHSIAFIPAFIVPYMSLDVVFVIVFLLAHTRFELRVLALRTAFIILASVLIFVIFPLQFSYEKPAADSFGFLFKLLEADKPFNQLPSLHVSFTVVFWFSMKSHMPNKGATCLLAIWLILIIISIVFVFQHHFIDLPSGLLMGIVAVYLFKEGRNENLLNLFMTPRHLKMAIYFLLGSAIFMVLSFKVSPLFMYLFISMLSVSLIYAFGANHFLLANNGPKRSLKWLLFAPYFLGCKLSWYCYKRTLPLCAKVDEGVFVGRHPSFCEYKNLDALGITQVINLASELQFNKTALIQHRFNFLDQTIQDPASLHKVVLLIEEKKSEGIYVHCALGLSRSILVIWAWMIFKGKSHPEIKAHLTQIRPRFVQSKYMQINIDLYCEHLADIDSL